MRYCCKIVDNLCNLVESTSVIGPVSDQLIGVFLEACVEPNRSASSINSCFSTILNLITISQNTVIANKYMEYVATHIGHFGGL